MNRILRWVAAPLLLLGALGCEIAHGPPPTGYDGEAVLRWTFGGRSCAAAGVATVRAEVDGFQLLDTRDRADLPCASGGQDGIVVAPLGAGEHVFSFSATGSDGTRWSLTNFVVRVRAGQTAEAAPDLLEAGAADEGQAYLLWTFAGMGCAQARVDEVRVRVDGADAGTVPCNSDGVEGAVVAPLTPGRHALSVSASRVLSGGARQLVYLSAAVSQPFEAGLVTQVVLDAAAVSPAVGGATLAWRFPAGGPDCAQVSGPGTPVRWTLVEPGGARRAQQTATCGGAAGAPSIGFCAVGVSGCAGSSGGLAPGLWTIEAAAESGGTSYRGKLLFPVPNGAAGTFAVEFAPQ